MIDIAVVILTMNQRRTTLRCLESFRAVERPPFRIILLDNGSSDGTAEEVRERFPEVLVHHNPVNLGVAAGRNAGGALAMERFTPSYLFFLDNDTRVSPGVLEALVAPFEGQPRLATTAPKLRFLRDPERIDMAGGARIRFWLASTGGIGRGELDRGQYDTPMECVTGGCVLVRTDVFRELEGFDTVFDPYGYQDIDFSLRAIKAGYRCLYVPDALIWHDPTQTFEGGRYTENLVRQKTRCWRIFLRRHASPLQRAAFYAIGLPILALRMLVREGRRGNVKALRGILHGARDMVRH